MILICLSSQEPDVTKCTNASQKNPKITNEELDQSASALLIRQPFQVPLQRGIYRSGEAMLSTRARGAFYGRTKTYACACSRRALSEPLPSTTCDQSRSNRYPPPTHEFSHSGRTADGELCNARVQPHALGGRRTALCNGQHSLVIGSLDGVPCMLVTVEVGGGMWGGVLVGFHHITKVHGDVCSEVYVQ